jgi:DNA polymerase III epsilon subunit-like protein
MYLAFDTETGALSPKLGDLLTAYFAILDENLNILEELDLKLKPDNGRLPIVSSEALKINGINIQEHLANVTTITYSEAKINLINLLKKYHKKTGRHHNIRAYGYNILGFDIGWLQEYLLPENEWRNFFHYKSVDVMQEVDFLKRVGWFPQDLGTLSTVSDFLGLPKRNMHEARNDVLTTIEVDKKILELMKNHKEGGQAQDLIGLLEQE